MSKIAKAFWTFSCDRCSRKESVSAPVLCGSIIRQDGSSTGYGRIAEEPVPRDWKFMCGKHYCPSCKAVIHAALVREVRFEVHA